MNIKKYDLEIGGEKMVFEFSDLTQQTNGAVMVTCGDTKVLVTAVMGEKTDKDYLPLKVDYEERFYAAGEILGSRYSKREGRPSTEAVLSARVIDRSIRPFFDKNLKQDVHIVATILSIGKFDPDILALNGAAIALTISDIPWNGPVGAMRIAKSKSSEIKINPDYLFREKNNYFEIVFAGSGNHKISMAEAEASEMLEADFLEVFDIALVEISRIVTFFNQIKNDLGKEKVALEVLEPTEEVILEVEKKENLRKKILATEERLDGRKLNEVRNIYADAQRISNIIHGSGIFYRGETHLLSVLTLGTLEDALFINGMEVQEEKNYIHHYNFPPFSVGETGRMGSPKRREIGHGFLAEKALKRMIPDVENFPYTMRIVSEVMSSNGSTSMAAVCASTLALLSGGVPIKNKVAGIAIGLVYENDDNYKILTDILGKEDYYGDMDFKIAGTNTGITAMQLDIKNSGISKIIIEESLERAKTARLEILDKMNQSISEPVEMSERVEKIEKIKIPADKIGLVIGKGGVRIKQLTKESGAKIDIKRDGQVFIYGKKESIKIAQEEIKRICNL